MVQTERSSSLENLADKLLSARSLADSKVRIRELPPNDAVRLAMIIRDRCYASWTKEPIIAKKAASVMALIAELHKLPEIDAIRYWVNGIEKVVQGTLDQSVDDLRRSSKIFRSVGHILESARPMVALLMVQAMMGHINEAIRTGRRALKIFLDHNDTVAAAKIELNMSNLFARSERHAEAERWCRSALERFRNVGEAEWEILAENGLANTYTEMNRLEEAESSLRSALANAARMKMGFTEAEIEASLGYLLRRTGRYSEALQYLESSRKRFESLKMPHQIAIALLEMAEAYAELNLYTEAQKLYAHAIKQLLRNRLTAEESRARIGLGQVYMNAGDHVAARREFGKAISLFEKTLNRTGVIHTKVLLLENELLAGRRTAALRLSGEIRSSFRSITTPRTRLLARFQILKADLTYRPLNGFRERLRLLLNEASKLKDTRLLIAILNETGKYFAGIGSRNLAIEHFSRSANIVERLRAPLPGIEFRRSFISDKLEPFKNLIEINIGSNDFRSAFIYAEKLRARTLLELVSATKADPENSDDEPAIQTLRQRLNWLYRLLNDADPLRSRKIASDIRKAESELSELERRLILGRIETSSDRYAAIESQDISIEHLQNSIGADKCLVEYVSTNDQVGVFVLGSDPIKFIDLRTNESEIGNLIRQFHFQVNAIRFLRDPSDAIRFEMKTRIDKVLETLYKKLIGPISHLIDGRSLVISPYGQLNYVPFSSLFDGSEYLIERHSITLTPSAEIWARLDKRKEDKSSGAILFSSDDASIPFANDEVAAISKLLAGSRSFTDKAATFSNFAQFAPNAEILHVVSHGQFRTDNPAFSNLTLSDRIVTAGDILKMKLNARLVTLSACETGLNHSSPGEELTGFTASLIAAGARSVLLSLWNVNDKATVEFMKRYYREISSGSSAAQALGKTQSLFAERGDHPYFWAPFVLIGGS